MKQYKAQTKQLSEYQTRVNDLNKTIEETTKLNEKLQNDYTELENKHKACLNIYEVIILLIKKKFKIIMNTVFLI